MQPIEEFDYSFHQEFVIQTNIQELQSRNNKGMFLTSFSLIHFKSSFYEFFWKTRKEVVHHRKMCWTKSLSFVNMENSVKCEYNFFLFSGLFFFTSFYNCTCTFCRKNPPH